MRDNLSIEEFRYLPYREQFAPNALERMHPDARREYETGGLMSLDESEKRRYLSGKSREAFEILEKVPQALVDQFDLDRHPNQKAHEAVMAWQFGATGLLLKGPTGNGKTRSLLQLMVKLAYASLPTIYLRAATFADEISPLAFQDVTELDKRLRRVESCEILAIDDLGAHRSSERITTAFHRIIDSRYGSGLPVLITTNSSAEELQRALQDEHGRTIRRIREMTKTIGF